MVFHTPPRLPRRIRAIGSAPLRIGRTHVMPVSLPAFGESFFAVVDEQAKRLTITSASFPLVITQGAASGDVVSVPADYDLVLRADRVVVRGTIRTPGRAVAIYA